MDQETQMLSGRVLTPTELEDLKYIVRQFSHLSRYELAQTICEGLEWFAPNGKYKKDACFHLLEKLEAQGEIVLPPKRATASKRQPYTNFTESSDIDERSSVHGSVEQYAPISLEAVNDREGIRLWNSFIERYHILGYKRPFGAHQRYFIRSGSDAKQRLGCLLFSASAWALAERDNWIGWSKEDRSQRLHLLVNNTRFLIFPWVKIKNLASHALSLAARQVPIDFQDRYGYRPLLLETFVDASRYSGTCYRAANWKCLGQTTGRGRMDRYNEHLSTPKLIFVYPLVRNFRHHLLGGGESR